MQSYNFSNILQCIVIDHLLMGWTNSVPIFHDDVTYILQPEIPHVTQPYIDNVPVKGPVTRYIKEDGEPETIPENPGIRQFVWEHFQDLNRWCIQQKSKQCRALTKIKYTVVRLGVTAILGCCKDYTYAISWVPVIKGTFQCELEMNIVLML